MHHNHGDWADSLMLACTATRNNRQHCMWHQGSLLHTASLQARCIHGTASELPVGYVSNASIDLRPKSVSNDRHTYVPLTLWTWVNQQSEYLPYQQSPQEQPKILEAEQVNPAHTLASSTSSPLEKHKTGNNVLLDPTERNVNPLLFMARGRPYSAEARPGTGHP